MKKDIFTWKDARFMCRARHVLLRKSLIDPLKDLLFGRSLFNRGWWIYEKTDCSIINSVTGLLWSRYIFFKYREKCCSRVSGRNSPQCSGDNKYNRRRDRIRSVNSCFGNRKRRRSAAYACKYQPSGSGKLDGWSEKSGRSSEWTLDWRTGVGWSAGHDERC